LKTRSKASALRASRSIASKLDDFWMQLRISEIDVSASHLLVKGKPKEAGHVKSAQDENSIFAGIKYKNLNLGGSYVDVSNRVEAEINYTIRW
jgi:hypothetical protein